MNVVETFIRLTVSFKKKTIVQVVIHVFLYLYLAHNVGRPLESTAYRRNQPHAAHALASDASVFAVKNQS